MRHRCLRAGDLNWADNRDGELPLPLAWRDAWRTLRPGEPGFTYNARANPMLSHRYEGSRLDRVLVRCSPPLAEEQPQVRTMRVRVRGADAGHRAVCPAWS